MSEWYKTSVREKLVENILNMLPGSIVSSPEARRYAHDFVYKLKLESVKPYEQHLLRDGASYVRFNARKR